MYQENMSLLLYDLVVVAHAEISFILAVLHYGANLSNFKTSTVCSIFSLFFYVFLLFPYCLAADCF